MAKKVSLGVVTLLAVLVSAAHAQPVVRDGLLADSAGRTVYTFDKDNKPVFDHAQHLYALPGCVLILEQRTAVTALREIAAGKVGLEMLKKVPG